jgi:hypothetical protein
VTDLPSVAGRWVAVPLGGLARWRRGKPMHPRGAVFDAVLERRGSTPEWGVPWLDEAATEPAQVRLSRSVGLPAPLPDLLGLAVRAPGAERPVDLLLTTTGTGPLGRFVVRPRWNAAAPYSSIMGYRSDSGILRIAALPEDDAAPSEPAPLASAVAGRGLAFTLAAACGAGPWRPFGRLRIAAPRKPLDPDVAFDAVQHPPPGLVADGPMARFRAPAYARARVARAPGRSSWRPGTWM